MNELTTGAQLILEAGQWTNGMIGKAITIALIAMGGLACATTEAR